MSEETIAKAQATQPPCWKFALQTRPQALTIGVCGFLMRGLANVRAELSLSALAYNLRRALNILGVEAMMTAVAA